MSKNDIDLPDMNFDFNLNMDPIDTKSRRPITSVKSNLKTVLREGIPSTVKSVGSHILRSMPSDAYMLGRDISESKDMLLDSFADMRTEVNKYFVTTKRATAYTLPKLKHIFPKKIYDKLDKFSKQNEEAVERELSPEELEKQRVNTALNEMFGNQTNLMASDMERKANEHVITRATEAIRHRSSMSVLASINDKMGYQNKFLGGIQQAWMRKVLELKYMHLYTARDTLNVLKIATQSLNAKLDAVVKNTALPDSGKQYSPEIMKYKMRGIMTDKGVAGLVDVSKYFKKVIANALGIGSTINDTANMAIDMGKTNDEMTGGGQISITKLLSKGVGKLLGTTVGQGLIEPLRPVTDRATRGARDITNKISTMGRDVYDFLNESKNPFLRLLGSGMKAPFAHLSVGNEMLNKGDQASVFDNMTRQSIVEVIPLWLSKIAKNTRDMVTGSDTEQEFYDVTKRKIRGVSAAKAAIEKRMLGTKETRSEGIIRTLGYTQGAAKRSGIVDSDFKSREADMLKFIDNAIANRRIIKGDEILRYADAQDSSELNSQYAKELFAGIKDPKALAQMLKTILYDDNKRLDIDTLHLLNMGIAEENKKSTMKDNFSKFIEDTGAYNLFADDIAGGNFSAEAMSKQRLDIDPTRFEKGRLINPDEFIQRRNQMKSLDETMQNSRLANAMPKKARTWFSKVADRNIWFVSSFARLFEALDEDYVPQENNVKSEHTRGILSTAIINHIVEGMASKAITDGEDPLTQAEKDKLKEDLHNGIIGDKKVKSIIEDVRKKSGKAAGKIKTHATKATGVIKEFVKDQSNDKDSVYNRTRNRAAQSKSGKVITEQYNKVKQFITKEITPENISEAVGNAKQFINNYKDKDYAKAQVEEAKAFLKKYGNKESFIAMFNQAKKFTTDNINEANIPQLIQEAKAFIAKYATAECAQEQVEKAKAFLNKFGEQHDVSGKYNTARKVVGDKVTQAATFIGGSKVGKVVGKTVDKANASIDNYLNDSKSSSQSYKAAGVKGVANDMLYEIMEMHETIKRFSDNNQEGQLQLIDAIFEQGNNAPIIGPDGTPMPRPKSFRKTRAVARGLGGFVKGTGKLYGRIYSKAFDFAKFGIDKAGKGLKFALPHVKDVANKLIGGGVELGKAGMDLSGKVYKGVGGLASKTLDYLKTRKAGEPGSGTGKGVVGGLLGLGGKGLDLLKGSLGIYGQVLGGIGSGAKFLMNRIKARKENEFKYSPIVDQLKKIYKLLNSRLPKKASTGSYEEQSKSKFDELKGKLGGLKDKFGKTKVGTKLSSMSKAAGGAAKAAGSTISKFATSPAGMIVGAGLAGVAVGTVAYQTLIKPAMAKKQAATMKKFKEERAAIDTNTKSMLADPSSIDNQVNTLEQAKSMKGANKSQIDAKIKELQEMKKSGRTHTGSDTKAQTTNTTSDQKAVGTVVDPNASNRAVAETTVKDEINNVRDVQAKAAVPTNDMAKQLELLQAIVAGLEKVGISINTVATNTGSLSDIGDSLDKNLKAVSAQKPVVVTTPPPMIVERERRVNPVISASKTRV